MTAPINEDFQSAASMSGFTGDGLYLLEQTPTRVTTLIKVTQGNLLTDAIKKIETNCQCVEIFILEGLCKTEDSLYYHQGGYLRLPDAKHYPLRAESDCILFVKLNQFLAGDDGLRTIDTTIADKWLPGPVEGTQIRPLHVFDTESIMLLKWQHAAEFKPNLNPRGEEILVINGLLQNRDNLHRQYHWIRNPIEDWRRWHGNTGTMIYYKSGHFPEDPQRVS